LLGQPAVFLRNYVVDLEGKPIEILAHLAVFAAAAGALPGQCFQGAIHASSAVHCLSVRGTATLE
jgi:hypothetical protein